MRTNVKPAPVFNHEGVRASNIQPIEQLRRTVLACLLWESGFYEDGEAIADRIKRLVPLCQPHDVAELAIEAREKQKLRHVPLKLVRELARDSKRAPEGLVASTLERVIQRADELSEFLAMYWNGDGRKPIAKQVKRGLAQAFQKFDEYALAKYNSRDAKIKLRDVLFMVHAKPKDEAQGELWKRLVDGRLQPADTWEVALSAGGDKREVFERLIREGRLGHLALLRNVRNMHASGVDAPLVFEALKAGALKSKALPFRYVAAARAAPAWEPAIDAAMQIALGGLDRLAGKTAVLIDTSPSMRVNLSAKSDLTRSDAAGALAVLLRGVCEEARVFAFSAAVAEVPPRAGMALFDAIDRAVPSNGTLLGKAVARVAAAMPDADRLVVFTDEESQDAVGKPHCRGYMVNVAQSQLGVGYGDWTHINGFSEAVVQYIQALEAQSP